MKIDWENDRSHLLVNPRVASPEQFALTSEMLEQRGHIWLATSGTNLARGGSKFAALSKMGILEAAQAVNDHLNSDQTDKWFLALPEFHIGGLAVHARAHLSGAEVLPWWRPEQPWKVRKFYVELCNSQATLVSLVPAQIADLVNLNLEASKSLRAVIVGGGPLTPAFYSKAIELGWPLLPSYGMTECSSQIATAELVSVEDRKFPSLKLLPHLQVKVENERLAFKGSSVLSCYAFWGPDSVRIEDPKDDHWYISSDRGLILEKELKFLGREGYQIKIGGENVDLSHLQESLEDVKYDLKYDEDATVVAVSDSRLGAVIHLILAGLNSERLEALTCEFNKRVPPFAAARKSHLVPFVPRTELGKPIQSEILKLIDQAKAQTSVPAN